MYPLISLLFILCKCKNLVSSIEYKWILCRPIPNRRTLNRYFVFIKLLGGGSTSTCCHDSKDSYVNFFTLIDINKFANMVVYLLPRFWWKEIVSTKIFRCPTRIIIGLAYWHLFNCNMKVWEVIISGIIWDISLQNKNIGSRRIHLIGFASWNDCQTKQCVRDSLLFHECTKND